MAVKPLEIHPSALEELKSALSWYLERNKTTAVKFAAELDRDGLAHRGTATMASWRARQPEIRPPALPACSFLSRKAGSDSGAANRPRAPATRITEGPALSVSTPPDARASFTPG